MKVVTYSRCSTINHDQKPEMQVNELRRYCEARGWEVVEEIVDHGFSGGTDKRPGLARLLSMVRARRVDSVVVVKLDRLFRSLKHLVSTLDEFNALGVTFIATADNVDYSTPAGRFFVQILGSLAEFEKALLLERTLMGLEHARQSGKVLGRPKTRDDESIHALRGQGLSYTEIQKKLGTSRASVYRALHAGVPKTPSISALESLMVSGGKNEK
jgi:DNA invertase Pin-like site-specific DNA recombinase